MAKKTKDAPADEEGEPKRRRGRPRKEKEKAETPAAEDAATNGNGGVMAVIKELWQAAVTLRGSIEPADYKRYVLPIIFLRFLSLRYERRRAELEKLIADPKSDYHGDKKALNDADEYRSIGAFIVPEAARWKNIMTAAQGDDIKIKLDDVLELLEKKYPDKLRGLLPRIYAGSNLDAESLRGLITLFSKNVFEEDHGGTDLIGRVYEYFIGEFASSEGKRGGEYFTPESIVKTLVAMLEPEKGVVFDPCCGSGGMFVQSDLFTKHNRQLSFVGQESKDFTYRLCRMNLFIHGLDGKIELGNSYLDDKHAPLKADYVIANPPFNDGSKGDKGWGADRVPDRDPRLVLGGEVMQLSPRNANTMWMLHFLHHLKEGAAAGFVMAAGELSNRSSARLATRAAIIDQNLLDCVVSLPGQLFANTPIPCSLWFLSKGRPRSCRSSRVLFIEARKLGTLIPGSRRQKQLSSADIARVSGPYAQFKRTGSVEAVPGFCAAVDLSTVKEHRYTLTPGRYVGSNNEEDSESFDECFPALRDQIQSQFESLRLLESAVRRELSAFESACD